MTEILFETTPQDWQWTTLGEVCALGGGDIQTGPFGSQLHAADYVPVGIPSVMPQNIGDNRVVADGIARITREDAERLGRYRLRSGDIVYSRRGDVERRALVREAEDGWLCGTGCLRVRLGEGVADPVFVSYYLGHPAVRAWVVRHAIGATMPNLNTSILSELPIVLPPLLEQKFIGEALRAFDQKIDVNRRMNETLDATARGIFKSWFVDFGPVHAKADGRQPATMDREISALFPSSFVSSDLGPVPSGWATKTLSAVADVVRGRSYSSAELVPSPTALVTLKSVARGGGYRPDGLKPFAGSYRPEQVVAPGEVVVACTDVTQLADVVGRPAVVRGDERYRTLVASLDLAIVRPHAEQPSPAFLYLLLRTDDFHTHAYGHTNGTTVLHLAKSAIPSYEFIMPDPGVLRAFDRLAMPMFRRIEVNEHQANTLAAVRDALLPELLSGRVPTGSVNHPRRGAQEEGDVQ